MTSFISRAYGGKEWEVIIKTDCKEHYEYAELFARKLIGHGKTHTMTNADRIRAMSDEELAERMVGDVWDCCCCSEYDRIGGHPLVSDERCDEKCKEHCLDWLKQPVKDGEDDE